VPDWDRSFPPLRWKLLAIKQSSVGRKDGARIICGELSVKMQVLRLATLAQDDSMVEQHFTADGI
jgi:hypothetical protein